MAVSIFLSKGSSFSRHRVLSLSFWRRPRARELACGDGDGDGDGVPLFLVLGLAGILYGEEDEEGKRALWVLLLGGNTGRGVERWRFWK